MPSDLWIVRISTRGETPRGSSAAATPSAMAAKMIAAMAQCRILSVAS